jgi:hypothetical protein
VARSAAHKTKLSTTTTAVQQSAAGTGRLSTKALGRIDAGKQATHTKSMADEKEGLFNFCRMHLSVQDFLGRHPM